MNKEFQKDIDNLTLEELNKKYNTTTGIDKESILLSVLDDKVNLKLIEIHNLKKLGAYALLKDEINDLLDLVTRRAEIKPYKKSTSRKLKTLALVFKNRTDKPLMDKIRKRLKLLDRKKRVK